MRKYYLAGPDARDKVNLLLYADKIISTVHSVMPKAEVTVSERWYSVSPTPKQGEAIKIGRALSSKGVLGQYCVHIPKLFNSIAIEEKEESNDKQPRNGGHH